MAKGGWAKFPYADKRYEYAGAALKKSWGRLHRGDCEPFPDEEAVQDAWRCYHRGDFGGAIERGLAAGDAGYNVASKAGAIYATYLETSASRKLKLLEDAADLAEKSIKDHPKVANAHYLHALALGRYGQGISTAVALKKGLGARSGRRSTPPSSCRPSTPTRISRSGPGTPRSSAKSGRWSGV